MIRLRANKKYKVYWVDIHSLSSWTSREDILKTPPTIIESVYIYVGNGRAGLCFAGEYNDGEYGNITFIPKGNIKKITLIK